ncbi:MAG: RNA polymerase sigma factor [Egibacteraceae bacterium]
MTTGWDDPHSDADLLRAIAGGDREAFKVLYDRHAPWLTARLGGRCANPDLVDEVVQDTFGEVWRSANRWRGEGEVGAWIWGIGRRRLVDAFRRRRRWTIRDMFDSRSDVEVSAEEQVLLDVEYGDLGGALRRLSPELLAVVQLCLLDGLTQREAARVLGVSRGAVQHRLTHARRQLRTDLT